MRRNVMTLLFLVFAVVILATPAWAEDGRYPVPQKFQQGEDMDSSGSNTVGGIEPVSPGDFSAKLQKLGDKLYSTASPLVDMTAKLSLAGAALLLLLVLILGAGVLQRVVGACFGVALGLLLFYCAPQIVAVIKYIAAWFGA